MPLTSLRPSLFALPLLLALALALLACARPAVAAPAGTAIAAAAAADEVASLAARLEGGWVGEATHTPMGPMPFALVFAKDPSGALHARTAMNAETFIDLRLARADDGTWSLIETAGLQGLGVQSHSLAPAHSARPGFLRFAAEDPAFMHVDLAADAGTLVMDVVLRGKSHARFDLRRIPDAEIPAFAAQLAAAALPAAAQPAQPAQPDQPDQATPDAKAQLDLGRRLLAELAENPASGPVNGPKVLQALRSAVALDPALAEPHRLLAIYHLNAPAIGGGSVEKALEEARLFARLDPEQGAALVAQIERRIQ